MQFNDHKSREKSACSVKEMPLPEFTECLRCGDEVEIWTDEEETHCPSCGNRIFKKESTIH